MFEMMTNKERQAVKECFDSLPYEEIAERQKADVSRLPLYITAYDEKNDRFYGIMAVRYLAHNYLSARILRDQFIIYDLGYYISTLRQYRDDDDFESSNTNELLAKQILIYNFDAFRKNHPDSGIELCDDSRYPLFSLLYAIAYREQPAIKILLKEGYGPLYYESLRDFPDGHRRFNGNGKTAAEVLKLPESLAVMLKDAEPGKYSPGQVQTIAERTGLSGDQLVVLLTDYELHPLSIERLFVLYKEYTFDGLKAYLDHCVFQTDKQPQEILGDLIRYRERCGELGIAAESYPVSLL